MAVAVLLLVVVAIIWGITNPMMKKGSEGIENCTSSSAFRSFLMELKFLFLNWKYLMAYGLNQCGSLLYYYALGSCELMIAGPLTNTLTFVVTYLSGKLIFGEKDESSFTKKLGLACICGGVTICLYDKLIHSSG
ncbi:unnamed protein product [Allacma fusca]|uniref:Transmembrane protein 234 n=1 Tax=Allacma fusca TaxID=39272 RepID=A0A8J2LSY0_9HEXA|nr:unnamed protein product [Allacma fusca]